MDPGGHPRAELHLGVDDKAATKHASSSTSTRTVQIIASSEVATYLDSDNVFVVTPTIAGAIANEVAGWRVNGRYLVDVVSAASADVVSTASPPFSEIRHAGTLEGTYKPHNFGVTATADVSFEPDYTSVMGGASITQDLFAKNLTLLFGYSHLHDIAGRTGTPFSVFSRTLDRDAFKGGATILRRSRDALVARRRRDDRIRRSVEAVSLRPDVRARHGRSARRIDRRSHALAPPGPRARAAPARARSLRALDGLGTPLPRVDVAIRAARVHRHVGTQGDDDGRFAGSSIGSRRLEVGPHLRFYGQTPVDFWQRAYVMNGAFDYPGLRTGNRELGPLINLTGGASLRAGLGSRLDPHTWVLGFDLNITSTQYLDDIYLTQRWSGVGSVSLEGAL